MARHAARSRSIVPTVYEDGVLRPLRPLALKNHQRLDIALLTNAAWAKAFRALLRRVHARPSHYRPQDIEAEITRAREEVRKFRRGRPS